MLAKYQNPKEADAMTKIQQDLDDTKIILVIFCFRLMTSTNAYVPFAILSLLVLMTNFDLF